MKIFAFSTFFAVLAASVRAQYFLRGYDEQAEEMTAHERLPGAWGAENGSRSDVDLPDGPFSLGDMNFTSRKEFILSGHRCRTEDYSEIEMFEIKQLIAAMPPEPNVETLRVRSIRVYFHIVTSSSNVGAVSDATIAKQMNVLNAAYRNSQFSFTLAGVTRTKNDAWYSAGINSAGITAMKKALRQGSYSDLNVYTTVQAGTLGWATLPTKVGGDISFDAVIVDYRTLPGSSFYPYNLGHTVTHETGHWLGLQHTFQSGCVVDTAGGDQVADTPAEKNANFGCPSDRTDSCPGNVGGLAGVDPIHNYMDYTDDSCMNNFTPDQTARMRQMYRLYRSG